MKAVYAKLKSSDRAATGDLPGQTIRQTRSSQDADSAVFFALGALGALGFAAFLLAMRCATISRTASSWSLSASILRARSVAFCSRMPVSSSSIDAFKAGRQRTKKDSKAEG